MLEVGCLWRGISQIGGLKHCLKMHVYLLLFIRANPNVLWLRLMNYCQHGLDEKKYAKDGNENS